MFIPDLENDYENFKHFLRSQNILFDIPKAEDDTDCNLIYLGGTAVAGAQLLVIKFYEDGEFREFVAYPDSEYQPTNNWKTPQGPLLLCGGLMDNEMNGEIANE